MSIVAITSKYTEESKNIAEHVALKLGYLMITMDDLIKAAAKEWSISEDELYGAVTDISLYHQIFRKTKMKLISLLELKLCELMRKNSLVFCGYLGYPIFQEVSHVLQALVLAHPAPEDGNKTGSAGSNLSSNDQISKWFKKIYSVDMENPNLYDLSVNLWHIDSAEAADIIINTLQQKRFTPMTYSKNVMSNLQLAYHIRTRLIEKMPDVLVKSHDGTVYVYSSTFKRSGKKTALETKQAIMWMDGVDYVEIHKDRHVFNAL